MKILLRNNQRKEWQKLEPRVYGKEHQLEELLAESPDLLPGEESERVIFFKRQVPLGQNAVDLLGVTSAGSITVVECKLDCNREARRTVIAQILEYGSQLWGMEYDEFEGLLSQGREEPLADTVRRLAGPGWSEEAFVAGTKRALENGDFRLVIAINGVTNELKGIMEYINCEPGRHIEALELQHFSNGGDEVLVPELFGTDARRPSTAAPPGRIRSLEEVYAAAVDPAAGRRLKSMVETWQSAGNIAAPGKSGLSFRTTIQGKEYWVFRAMGPNWLAFPRRHLLEYGIAEAIVEEFFSNLARASCADPQKLKTQREPEFKVSQMSDDDAQKVIDAAIRLVKRWKEQSLNAATASSD